MIVNENSMSQHVIQIKNGMMIIAHASVKRFCMCKKDYSLNHSTCARGNIRYFKSIADNSVIVCDEIMTRALSQ